VEDALEEQLARFAAAVGEPNLDDEEVEEVLDLARVVAHGTERRLAPLTTFLAGLAVARAVEGRSRPDALNDVSRQLRAAIPDET
jgi:hypothetical protein